MNLEGFSRIIFLLFIIVLSVYFIYVNKNYVTEPFLDDMSQQESKISQMYYNIFHQQPSSEELKFFVTNFNVNNLSNSQLTDIIATTAPIIQKTSDPLDDSITYGTEDDVIVLYNMVMNRNPSAAELKNYAGLLKNDSTFTKDKLIQILVSTEEYKRAEKTQSNTYNATLLGGVTEKQIVLTIDAMYTQMTGTQIDQDTSKFLQKKFVQFNLDEERLQQFILSYVIGSGIPITDPPLSTQPLIPPLSQHQPQQQQFQQLVNPIQNQITQDESIINPTTQENPWYTLTQTEITNQVSEGFAQEYINYPNEETVKCLLKTTFPDGYIKSEYLMDSQNVLDMIMSRGINVFDINDPLNANANANANKKNNYALDKLQRQKNETLLGDEIAKRNMEQLIQVCPLL